MADRVPPFMLRDRRTERAIKAPAAAPLEHDEESTGDNAPADPAQLAELQAAADAAEAALAAAEHPSA